MLTGQRFDRPEREVHVWRVELDGSIERRTALERLLSADEHARRGRFRFERDAGRWAQARGALRVVLALYTGLAAGDIVFDYGPFGKPALSAPGAELSFNVTHTGPVALVAVGGGRAMIGIDAEIVHYDVEWAALSRRFFAPAEADDLRCVPDSQQLGAFFACWTRKEALVKAMGVGLAMPLDAFRVSVLPNQPPAVLTVDRQPDAPTRWHLVDLGDATLAAALAVDVAKPVVRRFAFADLMPAIKRRPSR
jgi:4'-phosphopantetheinyl transferase